VINAPLDALSAANPQHVVSTNVRSERFLQYSPLLRVATAR
jgi:hypothetical protein